MLVFYIIDVLWITTFYACDFIWTDWMNKIHTILGRYFHAQKEISIFAHVTSPTPHVELNIHYVIKQIMKNALDIFILGSNSKNITKLTWYKAFIAINIQCRCNDRIHVHYIIISE